MGGSHPTILPARGGGTTLKERRPTVGKKARALILGVFPGLAHIFVLDRAGWGTLFFVSFILGVHGAILGLYVLDEEWASDAYMAGCAVAGATWLVSWLDVARLVVFRDYAKRNELRRRLTSEGVRFYSAGQLQKARGAFRECLDLDARDPDVLFWYGCVEAALGRRKRAARAFRRCRKYDLERKWDFELGREEERLERGDPGAAGG